MTQPTLGTKTLDKLKGYRDTKNGNLIPLPIPGSDADQTELFDMLGVTRLIVLTGQLTGVTSTIRTNRDALFALLNGDQSATVTLVCDQCDGGVGISVKIALIDTYWDLTHPDNVMDYTITLYQGV